MSGHSTDQRRNGQKTLNGRDSSGRTLPAEFLARQFKPGQSGNPGGGKGTAYGEVVRTARQYSLEAIDRLVELMRSDDERVAFLAAQALLDRAYGKPREKPPELPVIPHGDDRRHAVRALMIEALNTIAAKAAQ